LIQRAIPVRKFVAPLAVVLALALGPLTGCGANETGVGRIVTGYGYALNAESEAQLKRLRKIYDDNVIPESGSAQYEHFRDAFVRIKAEYVRDIKASELVDKALKGVEGLDLKPHGVQAAVLIEASLDQMIGDLDPHSNYLNADEFREMRVSMKGEFGGLGIRVSGENGVIKVVAPIKGTPAYRAGLKPGDLVTHVDGTALKGLSLSKAVQMMRGRPGTDIRLTIERRDVTPFVVTITRAVIKIDAVTWRAEGNIGYIRVNSFVGKLEEDMNDAVKGLRKEIGPKLAGLVLDLRNNPGGLLDQSVFLADMFKPSCRCRSKAPSSSPRRCTICRRAGPSRGRASSRRLPSPALPAPSTGRKPACPERCRASPPSKAAFARALKKRTARRSRPRKTI
jgi:carboxyl-terminal processing protease